MGGMPALGGLTRTAANTSRDAGRYTQVQSMLSVKTRVAQEVVERALYRISFGGVDIASGTKTRWNMAKNEEFRFKNDSSPRSK